MVGYPDVEESPSALGFDADPVVNGGSNALLAAEVSLGCLNRDVSQQKLNPFQFAACGMT
jgi:hypothetical protein